MNFRIPVAAPVLNGNEKQYVNDCLEANLVSSFGPYVERFEQAFAKFCGSKHAIAVSNGTVALHAALLALEIGPNDEVLVPSLTFIATANAVTYCGAKPVFVDCDPKTWTMCPQDLQRKITSRTKAIIPVHLYGLPCDMGAIKAIAQTHSLPIIEDAAEAHGAEVNGKRVGSLGRLGVFSFYGNKILTTGEGGMIVTDDDLLAKKIRHLKGQGHDPSKRYWFTIVGYNYRMTNIAAALGLAQVEKADWHCKRRLEIAEWYSSALHKDSRIITQKVSPGLTHAQWMYTIRMEGCTPSSRDQIAELLAKDGIETRPVFYPLHTLPPYSWMKVDSCKTSELIAGQGLNLPTWAGLTRSDIDFVCSRLVTHRDQVLGTKDSFLKRAS